jgi:hypothetical protein
MITLPLSLFGKILKNLSAFTAFFSLYFGAFANTAAGFMDKFVKDYGLESILNIDKKIEDAYKNEGEQHYRGLYSYAAINWVYDLFRPGEPYSARGPHPSGDGIARYITLAQLSDEEYAYLVKQGWLSYLNFLSPLLYGFNSFPLGNTDYDWNAALRHYLTSFGTDSPVQFLLKKTPFNMVFTWHNYMNYANYYTAVEAELRDFPFTIGGFTTYLSPRALIGIQPKDQVFKTGEAEFLGLIGLRADFAVSKHVLPYFELTLKTDGWVAGNEYLDRNVSCVMGLSARF